MYNYRRLFRFARSSKILPQQHKRFEKEKQKIISSPTVANAVQQRNAAFSVGILKSETMRFSLPVAETRAAEPSAKINRFFFFFSTRKRSWSIKRDDDTPRLGDVQMSGIFYDFIYFFLMVFFFLLLLIASCSRFVLLLLLLTGGRRRAAVAKLSNRLYYRLSL